MRITFTILAIFMATVGFVRTGYAQATNASILGTVLNEDGSALAGATVKIKNESTGFLTGAISQVDGRYQLRQLPLGGPYTVTISYIGLATQERKGYFLNQGDQVVVDAKMSESAIELEAVEIRATGIYNDIQNFGAATNITSNQIKALPLEGRNFTGLVALSPLSNGFNLGGQRSGSTNITIDGANARSPLWAGVAGSGPYAISQEAIREFEVVTNAYDVTQGRQSGGAVNAVTKFGTNQMSGTAFVYGWNDQLASKFDIRGNNRTQNFSTYQYGLSLGGPIIKDKLHYFLAFDRQEQERPVSIADIRTQEDEIRLGIRKDTLEKALEIARRLYGLGEGPQVGEFPRKLINNTLFVRLDWTLNDKHKLTFRNNLTNYDNPINADDNNNIVVRETWNKQLARSYTGMLSLRSVLKPGLTNELKVQFQHEYTEQVPSDELPALNIPRAIVSIRSPFPTSTNPNATTTRTFQIGGQRFTPEKTKYNQLHIVNTSYLTKGKYNFTFGTDSYISFLADVFTSELNGRFIFNSLKDFERLNPSRYVREVYLGEGEPWVRYDAADLSLFGQVDFNPTPNINLVAGLRWDITAFLTGANYNEVVDRTLGIRTDNAPVDLDNFGPRFQMTWNIGGRNTDILKIGAGGFSALAMYYNQANNMLFDGTKVASIDISAPSPLLPKPDFNAYREDPTTAPGVPEGAKVVSTINAMGENFEVPFTWKANVNYNKILLDGKLRLGANFILAHTVNNYVYQERNLVDEPYFRLSNEGGRGVFVPADKIARNGQVDWQDSRKTLDVGRVLELVPDGFVDQYTIVFDAQYQIGKDGYLNASYTWNDTRDNSSYNCCVANTSTFLPVNDDPRKLNYGYSDSHFRHKVQVNGSTPTIFGFTLGATMNGFAGTPFTLHAYRVGTSLNGDFNDRNDVAFLFDPNSPSTPAALAKSINDWLANPAISDNIKELYRNNIGKLSPRNEGANPFFATVDARLAYGIKTIGKQSIELSADAFNFLNLLNKEWGRNKNVGIEQRILNITGFDAATNNYTYSFNSNTGLDPIGGTPWRIQLGVRYNF